MDILNGQGYVKVLETIPGEAPRGFKTKDAFIVQAALVSTWRDLGFEEQVKEMLEKLISWGHYSPFEQAVVSLEIKAPLVCFWQLDRHRTFRYASHIRRSGRYSQFSEEEFYIPEYFDEGQKSLLEAHVQDSVAKYSKSIIDKTKKESARFFLPAWCMLYTEIMNVDLKNLFHFLALREDTAAQYEIRELAKEVHYEVSKEFPYTFEIISDKLKPINYEFGVE